MHCPTHLGLLNTMCDVSYVEEGHQLACDFCSKMIDHDGLQKAYLAQNISLNSQSNKVSGCQHKAGIIKALHVC